jgi:hypothetical protein
VTAGIEADRQSNAQFSPHVGYGNRRPADPVGNHGIRGRGKQADFAARPSAAGANVTIAPPSSPRVWYFLGYSLFRRGKVESGLYRST